MIYFDETVKKIKKGILKIKIKLSSLKYYLLRILPINNNKIVIINRYGEGFGGNGKYISLKLLENKANYDIVWLLHKNTPQEEFPVDIKIKEYGSFAGLIELITARIWIDNCRKEAHVRKRRGQIYINTGHGGTPLKKIEHDAVDNLSLSYILKAKNDSKMTDYMLSNSKFRTEILRNSYWYNGEILEIGIPKIEVLMNENINYAKKVRKFYELDNDINILLYAPTFRRRESFQNYDINFKTLQESLSNRFGGEWIILFRLHPELHNDFKMLDNNVIDATGYPDMQELLTASDVLITDYSGTMFEFIHKDKPVFLYAKDVENYDRGFYFNFDELPFPLAVDNYELNYNIINFDKIKFDQYIDQFKSKIGLVEKYGASDQLVCMLRQLAENKKLNH